jgi:uncharacterized protein YhaN
MPSFHTSSLEPNPSRTMTDPIHPEGIIPTGPYRDDLASAMARLQAQEREIAELRLALQEKETRLAEAEDKENARVNFYLEFGDEEIKRLEAENRSLHQQVIVLSGASPGALVSLRRELTQLPRLEAEFRWMRKDVARTRLLFVVAVLVYMLMGWAPL